MPAAGGPRRRNAAGLKASRSNARHSMRSNRSTNLLAGQTAATGLRHSRAPAAGSLIRALDQAEDCWPFCPAPCGPRRRSAAGLKASRSNVRHSMRSNRSTNRLAGHVAATGLRHSRAAGGGVAHSSIGPGRGLLAFLSRALRTATPERGCAESQPQQRPPFNGLDPFDQPSGWPRCCDWSATQSRSAKRVEHSSYGPGRGLLSCLSRALRTATPERGCAESQPQQRPSFNGLDPFDQPSGWPRCCDWSATQSRSGGGVAHSSYGSTTGSWCDARPHPGLSSEEREKGSPPF